MEEKAIMNKETPSPQLEYAGMWIRSWAGLIDVILLFVGLIFIGITIFFMLGEEFFLILLAPFSNTITSPIEIMSLVLIIIYFAALQTSNWQGTVGMRACKIKLTNLEGEKTTLIRIFVREFAAYISWSFFIGYLMIAFTKKKQGLHDKLTNTIVIHYT